MTDRGRPRDCGGASCEGCRERESRASCLIRLGESVQIEANAREKVRQLKKELKIANAALAEEQRAHDGTKQKLVVAQENQYAVYEGAAKEWDKIREQDASALRDTKELLREAFETMRHAGVFIGSREKMHPDGRELYARLLERIDLHLYPKKGGLG